MLKEPTELWDALAAFDVYLQRALFAHCASLSVNAIYESHDRKPRAVAHADRLAQRVDLDMVAAGWKPTVESFLSRVTKARIFGAVREARGNQAAQLIDHLKKGEMAAKAEELLDGSGWLPEVLRLLGHVLPKGAESAAIDKLKLWLSRTAKKRRHWEAKRSWSRKTNPQRMVPRLSRLVCSQPSSLASEQTVPPEPAGGGGLPLSLDMPCLSHI